ncbi:Vacuolar ATPase assembly protein VMA22 [Caenorhabditis elegans]|uniref:Vacuolar ATPase assembly protein VMA22 n=1 Tax=Caenorhabditis elegans TaxID=6239 RepID=O01314_CAEEL|nr:Protein yippee-like [Caenorhabditis elegans]CAB04047.1 Protein yippee-like [Caenorhabditis elegans]|eukprot:NP_492280.1 Uncharacterized protein CELE_F02E9.1 [Caenorhabditis elegans]
MELIDKFITLHDQLRKDLNLASLCISKAKTTHGIGLFSVNSVDTHDLEPSIRLDTKNGKFVLLKNSENEEEKNDKKNKKKKDENKSEKKNSGESEDVEEAKKTFSGQFRPFGVLEPAAAKDARKIYRNSIQTILDLVSTQQSILAKSRQLVEDC